jgi:hypothetical protein
MMKRILGGLLWVIVLYFGACALVGAVAGAIAGGNDPQNAAAAGAKAGAETVAAVRLYLLLGASALAALGTWLRLLPGTRRRGRPKASVDGT